MKFFLFISFFLLACSDDVVSIPTFNSTSYDLKVGFRSADTTYLYMDNYIDSIFYSFKGTKSDDSITGFNTSLEFDFNDSLFLKDTIKSAFKFVDRNGIETFYSHVLKDSSFININGESIDLTLSLKRKNIKGHKLVNKTTTPSDSIVSFSYQYFYAKDNTSNWLDTIFGSGNFVGDTLLINSSADFNSSIFSGSYSMSIIALDSDSIVLIQDTISNILLHPDEFRIDTLLNVL